MLQKEALINWAETLEAVGGDPQILKEMVEAFLQEGPTRLAELRQAVRDQNAKVVRRQAHTLKTSLRYFGVEAAAELALRMEELGMQAEKASDAALLGEIPALFSQFEPQLTRVIECLAAYRGEATP